VCRTSDDVTDNMVRHARRPARGAQQIHSVQCEMTHNRVHTMAWVRVGQSGDIGASEFLRVVDGVGV